MNQRQTLQDPLVSHGDNVDDALIHEQNKDLLSIGTTHSSSYFFFLLYSFISYESNVLNILDTHTCKVILRSILTIVLVGEMTGLNSLMKDISSMVSDQGVALDQVEQNVKTSDVLVDEGVEQIQYVLSFISSLQIVSPPSIPSPFILPNP
jgi:hypothetical protein